jgi:hypothetical protein
MSSRKAPEYVDQVARRIEFEQRHPQVTIRREYGPPSRWIAEWTDADDTCHKITVWAASCAYPLERLLDKLGEVFGG